MAKKKVIKKVEPKTVEKKGVITIAPKEKIDEVRGKIIWDTSKKHGREIEFALTKIKDVSLAVIKLEARIDRIVAAHCSAKPITKDM